jgi:hypothetical protein
MSKAWTDRARFSSSENAADALAGNEVILADLHQPGRSA